MNFQLIQQLEITDRQSTSLFETLKQSTQESYQEVEASLPFMSLSCTREQYREHLVNLLGFYIPLEENINLFVDGKLNLAPFEFSKRSKSLKIISDLVSLGATANDLAAIPLCYSIKAINNLPELVGVYYFVERLALTGQIIQRELRSELKLDDKAISYYAGYGKDTFQMWNKFRFQSESNVTELEKVDAVISARGALRNFKLWCNL